MGCDIHTAVEVRRDGEWHWDGRAVFPSAYDEGKFVREPFDWRNYGMFGFLANVRNYSRVPPISEDRGLPADLSPELSDQDGADVTWLGDHSFSWLSLAELQAFDYDQSFEDRRCTVQTGPRSWDGAGLAKEGEGEATTFREFLGESFFKHLEILKTFGAADDVRVVFGFDS
jgi:hypothetical protein